MFSRYYLHHAQQPARFHIKIELVCGSGARGVAKTQYVCHFRVVGQNAVFFGLLGSWGGLGGRRRGKSWRREWPGPKRATPILRKSMVLLSKSDVF